MYDILSLGEMLLPDLRKIADEHSIVHKGLKKQDLAYKILDFQAVNPEKFKNDKPANEINSDNKTEEAKPPRVKKAAPIRKVRTEEDKKDAPQYDSSKNDSSKKDAP